MKEVSTSTEAIAWMLAKAGRTQVDASEKFGISQGAISSTKSREDRAILLCERLPKVVAEAFAILEANPIQTARGVAYKLGIPEAEARSIVLGLHAKSQRDAAVFKESSAHMGDVSDELDAGSRFGWGAGKREMRERCAVLAETIGGVDGAALATAIRSLGV